MKRFAVVVEYTPKSHAAYVLALPGCIATGASREEALRNTREAVDVHIEGLREDLLPIPEPVTKPTFLEVDA